MDLKPLVSVIIPTYGRPTFLKRAIDSARESEDSSLVEVVVVPNGPDESWRRVAEQFKDAENVRFLPIATAHANAARNYGLLNAKGSYVRFLDDDDYLFPSAAHIQVEYLEKTGADVCSGLLLNVDHDETPLGTLGFPDTGDFVCAALSVSGFTLPTGNLFRRECLQGAHWNTSVNRAQDNVWMLDLAGLREWNWVHVGEHVGVWYQHAGPRTSTVRLTVDRPYKLIEAILNLHERLGKSGRLNRSRQEAIAEALWRHAHWRFPIQPIYWSSVARKAKKIAPWVGPDHSIFESPMLRHLDPLVVEWLMYPLRRIARSYRDAKASLIGWDYRRRL